MFRKLRAIIRDNSRLVKANKELLVLNAALKENLIASKTSRANTQLEIDRIIEALPKLEQEIREAPRRLQALEERGTKELDYYKSQVSEAERGLHLALQKKEDLAIRIEELEGQYNKLQAVSSCGHDSFYRRYYRC
jgi:vacuolar-type H+-ATPase subunit D/Vma8